MSPLVRRNDGAAAQLPARAGAGETLRILEQRGECHAQEPA